MTTSAADIVPTEKQEHKTLVAYLRVKQHPHFHVANETSIKSHRFVNKSLGVDKGVPDFFVVVTKLKKSIVNNNAIAIPVASKLIAIELKRRKKSLSRVSPEQKLWIERLNAAGIEARVCNGAGEGIAFIEEVYNAL